jgi:uncharacterized protein
VTEVDIPRNRIGLSMRRDGGASAREDRAARGGPAGPKGPGKGPRGPKGPMKAGPKASGTGAFGAALMDAMKRR